MPIQKDPITRNGRVSKAAKNGSTVIRSSGLR
jgi:hypothetical protein